VNGVGVGLLCRTGMKVHEMLFDLLILFIRQQAFVPQPSVLA
jgi:hypothetical protein